MLKIYKNSKFSTRIISLLMATGLIGYIAYVYGYDWLSISLVVVAVGVLLETFIIHTKFILTTLIALLNILVTGVLAFTIYEIMQYNPDTQFLGFTNLIVLQLGGVVTTISVVTIAYLFSQGRVWLNALTSFLIYNTVLVLLIINTSDEANFIYATIASFFAGIIYVILRAFLPLKGKVKFDLNQLPKSNATTAFVKKLQKNNPELKTFKHVDNSIVVYNDTQIFYIVPIAVNKSFTITRREIVADEKNITPALEAIIEHAQDLSHTKRISQKLITPILLVANKSITQRLTGIKVRRKNHPDRVIGTVFITNENGLNKLFNLNRKTKLSKDNLQALTELQNY